ncbi:hypothetical protein Tco_0876773 [Tanacetum coccineum]|uniref:Uncharacterized protein n=1 Tax=Tanacetum coccineum TaxID=301880 RepID=A0ABQ5BVY1_9ASTR
MDDPNITMEEYIRLEEEKAHRRDKVYNWETATYVSYDFDYFKEFEKEFPAIAYNDALTSKLDFSPEPNDNDNDKIDIKESSGDNVINTDVGASAQGSNKLFKTSHDTISKIFTAKICIEELSDNVVTWNYLNKGMPFIFIIKNLYVPFGISFYPKLFYKDEIKLGQV